MALVPVLQVSMRSTISLYSNTHAQVLYDLNRLLPLHVLCLIQQAHHATLPFAVNYTLSKDTRISAEPSEVVLQHLEFLTLMSSLFLRSWKMETILQFFKPSSKLEIIDSKYMHPGTRRCPSTNS